MALLIFNIADLNKVLLSCSLTLKLNKFRETAEATVKTQQVKIIKPWLWLLCDSFVVDSLFVGAAIVCGFFVFGPLFVAQ